MKENLPEKYCPIVYTWQDRLSLKKKLARTELIISYGIGIFLSAWLMCHVINWIGVQRMEIFLGFTGWLFLWTYCTEWIKKNNGEMAVFLGMMVFAIAFGIASYLIAP